MKHSSYGSVRKWSIISGISLLVMAIAAGIAYGGILQLIHVEGDAIATAANIEAYASEYFMGILLWILILVTDLLVSFGFYRFLSTIGTTAALVSGLLRLIYSIILGIGIVFMAFQNIAAFLRIWSFGLMIFGLHLIVTGALLWHGPKVLKVLGVLLLISGIGYCLVHGIENFFPWNSELATTLESWLGIPMAAGEFLFGLWLLIFGGRGIKTPVPDGV
jgi:hypothetical protein